MKSLIIRIIKQMKNDKRTLALLLVAPLMIMSLMYLLLGESSYKPVIGVDDGFNTQIRSTLENQDVSVVTVPKSADIDAELRNKDIDAMITMDKNGIRIRMLESEGTKVAKITDALKASMAAANPAGVMDISFIYGDAKASLFNNLAFVLLGFIPFFLIFLLSGVSFIRERTTGTLERLMLTPVKRYQVVTGYTLGFGIFAVLQSIFITLYCQYVLQIQIAGSVLLCIFIMILLAFAAVSTGTLISIFADNEFQVMQFIPIIIIPQIFFSGLISIDTLPYHLGNLAYVMPIYYGCTALQEVILKGSGLADIWGYLLALLLFTIVLSVVNTLALKKYRQI